MPGPQDVPDPADIITEPCKCRIPAHLNNDTNSSTDPTLKRLRKGGSATQPGPSHTRSPAIEIEEDQDALPAQNIPPRNPANIIESSDDEENNHDEKCSLHTQITSQDTTPPSRLASCSSVIKFDDNEDSDDGGVEEEQDEVFPPLKKKKGKASQLHKETTVLEEPEEDPEAMLVSKDGKAKVDNSTGNLFKHARKCWGKSVINQAVQANDLAAARAGLETLKVLADRTITATFERTGKGKVTFSTKPLKYPKTRVECVCWVAKSMWPASVVGDCGFLRLMKTGRPHMKIPSWPTISQDVHVVFKKVQERIAELLKSAKSYDGRLNFATDAWTSPNHRPFVAVTVHMEKKGQPVCMLLNIVELLVSHSGINLAAAFVDILCSYGIEHKLLSVTCDNTSANNMMINEIGKLILSYPGAANR
ncbi:hypothetical protein H1R20_g862, partial [Candolleomyces eurysporus]